MSLKARSGNEKVATGGKTLYTGIGNFKCVAFNPGADDINEILGIDNAKEPVYITDKDDSVRTVMLSFYMEEITTGVKYVHTFFVNNVLKKSRAGQDQFTNSVGQFYYGTPQTFHSTEGVREAFEGEEDFVTFLQALFNLKTGKDGDQIHLNWDSIMNGDFSYIDSAVETLDTTNTVGILMGIKTGDNGKSYMTGYKRAYLRPYQGVDKISKELNSAYGTFKYDYQNDFTFKPYVSTSNTTSAAAPATVASSPW
jgi:hypothetical protein